MQFVTQRKLAFLVLLLLASTTVLRAQSVERPNVLILFSDDQRADAVGAHGNPHIRTPNIDALVERGFSFRRAYVMGSHHGAVCAPSRAMLMTGRNLFRVYDNLDSVDTFPQRLQEVGYETFGTGKWHQSREAFVKSFGFGKNIFFGGMDDHFRTDVTDRLADGTFTEPEPRGYSTTVFADAAIAFIEDYATSDRQAPFLAYVSFTAPHDPRTPPDEFLELYEGEDMPLPSNFMPQHPFDLGPMSMAVRDEHLAPWPRTTEVVREQIAEYYGLITHLDSEIGRILQTLERTGLSEKTVVIFAADNGLALGSHGMMGKQSLYEHSTHVPLIITGPGVPHGESNALTYLYDLAPTILEITGASTLPRMDGHDLSPIWRGELQFVRKTLFTAFHDRQRAVRDDRWKLIRYPRIDFTQLFDLMRDPHELDNVAGDSRQRRRVEDMTRLLESWQQRMGDPHALTVAEVDPMAYDYQRIERKPDQWQPDWVLRKYFPELAAERPPNVIVIFADDLGYADVGVYGAEGYETPNLDRMAAEGIRFTSFYAVNPACTPSRAALLTGMYPDRVGLPEVLFPGSTVGLNPDEITIAELLKSRGYATAAIGKWHLGDHPVFLPTNHGFDTFFGLPYSNDMSPDSLNNPRSNASRYPPLPLLRDTVIVEREPDQSKLTSRYTDEAMAFMETHRDTPFFVYLPHTFPHVPLYASDDFRNSTRQGLYGDVIAEIDASVGEILAALDRLELDRQTIVFFTSDNGPWLVMGNHGGSAGPFREGKATTFEGGHRVPSIVRWPERIAPGTVSDAMITAMDLTPTIAEIAGVDLPRGLAFDGHDLSGILTGDSDAASPYDHFFFYRSGELRGVRSGRWKLHVPHRYASMDGGEAGRDGLPGTYNYREQGLALYDLDTDPGETTDVAQRHPEIVDRLLRLVEQGRRDIGDALTNTRGENARPPGRVPRPWPDQRVND